MNILVAGCGKVGSRLAYALSERGFDVCVVEQDAELFDNLPSDFVGYTIHGVPIDQDILKKAGIEGSDAVIAVTEDDNINIMLCEVAKEIFGIKKVLARIYDPKRQDVFSHFGLHTVCPTNITVDAVVSALVNDVSFAKISVGANTLSFSQKPAEKSQIGKDASEILEEDNEVLFAVLKASGELILKNLSNPLLIEENDTLIFSKVSN